MKRKLLKITFAVLFLLLIVGTAEVEAKDYSLENANIEITIYEDGIVNVKEAITYDLDGCFRELYREFELPFFSQFAPGAQEWIRTGYIRKPVIFNITGHCAPEARFLIQGNEAICRSVYNNLCSTRATLFLDYNMSYVLKQYNDGVTEFHYKIWGEKWEKELEKLNVEINLPRAVSQEELMIFFHPSTSYNYENGKITISTSVSARQYFETRVVFPSSIVSGANTIIIDAPGLEQIEKIESGYRFGYIARKFLGWLVLILVIFLFPFLVYRKYGREPQTDYLAEFERSPPTKDKAYIVNSIAHGRTLKIDGNAFTATLLDLIMRKYIKMHTEKRKKGLFKKEKEDLIFEVTLKGWEGKLTPPEVKLLTFLKGFEEEDGKIRWDKVKTEYHFRTFFKGFSKKIKEEVKAKQYFNKKGAIIVKIPFAVLLYLSSHLMFLWFPHTLIMLVASIVYVSLPARVFGSFSKEGLLFYRKWFNFRKFLSEVTLIKKYPPSSLVVWEKYLVYATALGVADEVKEVMEVVIPEDELKTSDILFISTYSAVFANMSSFATSTAPKAGGAGAFIAGVAGAGGGFGGGGGGAR